jgi:Ca2+/H+ antiporter, TMEM165/GDT1 family
MEFLDLLWAYVVVFVLSAVPFFEAFGVITLGILAGLSVLPVVLISLIGNILTVLLLILFINKINDWRKKRKGEKPEKQQSKRTVRAQNLWKKYGLPGLALIGPLFVGSHLTAFMCVTLGGQRKKASIWMVTSITVWGLVFALLAYYGVDFLGYEDNGVLKDMIQAD